jgi:SAM-dependent methyltransferase
MDRQLDNQVEYWDGVASSKTFTHPLDLPRFSQLVGKDSQILDFGCGYGRLCGDLWQAGFMQVLGVDSSPKMIERARALFPGMQFEVVQPPSLPFPAGAFDAVTLFAVLTCVISNEAQQRLIQEVSRVLRPGGIVYISDYPLQEDKRNTQRYQQYRSAFAPYGTFQTVDGAVVRAPYLRVDRVPAQWIEKARAVLPRSADNE